MRLRSLLPAAIVAVAGAAHADPRIATHFFQSSEVVEIHGRADTQSTIAFATDERIENVAVGDSAGWQVTPNKRADLLFLKPTKPGARTNMTVVTDQHTYLFDLVSAPRAAPVYMLRFTYPAPPPPKPVPAAAVTTLAAAAAPLAKAEPDPTTLNFAWVRSGDKALLPSRLFDDGHSTFLAWPKDVPLPAILTSETKGVEGPVNYATRGDYVVVDGVPAQIILRAGKQVAKLTSGTGEVTTADRYARKGRHTAAPAIKPGPPYATFASAQQ